MCSVVFIRFVSAYVIMYVACVNLLHFNFQSMFSVIANDGLKLKRLIMVWGARLRVQQVQRLSRSFQRQLAVVANIPGEPRALEELALVRRRRQLTGFVWQALFFVWQVSTNQCVPLKLFAIIYNFNLIDAIIILNYILRYLI